MIRWYRAPGIFIRFGSLYLVSCSILTSELLGRPIQCSSVFRVEATNSGRLKPLISVEQVIIFLCLLWPRRLPPWALDRRAEPSGASTTRRSKRPYTVLYTGTRISKLGRLQSVHVAPWSRSRFLRSIWVNISHTYSREAGNSRVNLVRKETDLVLR